MFVEASRSPMRGSNYLLGDDRKLVTMEEEPYDSETLLQELLANYPSLLTGDQMNPSAPRTWLLVKREAGIPGEDGGGDRWSVDHLFLDQDAVPTLVEVKRSSDTRLRREVIGQMLDYAANAVVYWPADRVRALFETECDASGLDPTARVQELCSDDRDPESFWSDAERNLQAGRIRLVFVADVIPPELARIVEFLNQQMYPAEVLAVEVRQFVGEGRRTLVPRVLGQTAQAQQKKAAPTADSRQWDEPSFFSEMARGHEESLVRTARRLLDWGKSNELGIWWGKGAKSGSFSLMCEVNGVEHSTFSVWTYGSVEIQFQSMKKREAFASEEARRELGAKLNDIPGVQIREDAISKRPNVKLAVLEEDDALDSFVAVFDWYLERIRAAVR
jgi:hypothetical protein